MTVDSGQLFALGKIIDGADLLMVDGDSFLLVQVDQEVLDTLAAYDAEAEDMEEEPDREICCENEVVTDDEPYFLHRLPQSPDDYDSLTGLPVTRRIA